MANTVERASAFVSAQIGKETTRGTGVAATAVLRGLMVTPQAKIDTKEIRGGGLAPVAYALGRDYVEAKVEGTPSFEELGFILNSALCQPALGVYAPENYEENVFDSYTIQVGNATSCESFTGGVFTGFGIKYTPESVDLTADIIGNQLAAPGTWTAALTPGNYSPILPGQCTVKVATVTQTRVFEFDLNFTGHLKPIYTINGSYVVANLVESKPDGSIKIECEMDAQGLAHLTRLRAGNATTDVEINAVNATRNFKLNMATQIKDIDSFKMTDTTYNVAYTLGMVYDENNSYYIKATLDSTI